eukprot:CAMPEP_0201510466 /NCGR_PEP_ID=MMETSP0161_2-20130828/3138_1 /ASSEMBLY_ACC=CAM_ASM_000251 /TAXON_ID=180227 /ORGANISM="Neoparamoeba aestuarina, Strain SoJaBio B1-5/56/2" /LENGTH=92 /DNA_ID=CAMNT_0047905639 /DNA_START=420 /DNA_END=698 /DNA_ORIENTATION=+
MDLNNFIDSSRLVGLGCHSFPLGNVRRVLRNTFHQAIFQLGKETSHEDLLVLDEVIPGKLDVMSGKKRYPEKHRIPMQIQKQGTDAPSVAES